MTTQIDISGLDKVELLWMLYVNQKIQGFCELYGLPPRPSDAEARAAVGGMIDYFGGKAIKTDLSGSTVNPFLYDRDAGAGAFARIVEQMRQR